MLPFAHAPPSSPKSDVVQWRARHRPPRCDSRRLRFSDQAGADRGAQEHLAARRAAAADSGERLPQRQGAAWSQLPRGRGSLLRHCRTTTSAACAGAAACVLIIPLPCTLKHHHRACLDCSPRCTTAMSATTGVGRAAASTSQRRGNGRTRRARGTAAARAARCAWRGPRRGDCCLVPGLCMGLAHRATASQPVGRTPPPPQRDEEGSSAKKPRVVWSVEMHQQFVAAVNRLGIDSAFWLGMLSPCVRVRAVICHDACACKSTTVPSLAFFYEPGHLKQRYSSARSNKTCNPPNPRRGRAQEDPGANER